MIQESWWHGVEGRYHTVVFFSVVKSSSNMHYDFSEWVRCFNVSFYFAHQLSFIGISFHIVSSKEPSEPLQFMEIFIRRVTSRKWELFTIYFSYAWILRLVILRTHQLFVYEMENVCSWRSGGELVVVGGKFRINSRRVGGNVGLSRSLG
jgi:hypothetical protein